MKRARDDTGDSAGLSRTIAKDVIDSEVVEFKPTETAARVTCLTNELFDEALANVDVKTCIKRAVGQASGAWRSGTRLMELYLRTCLAEGGGKLPVPLNFGALIRHCVTSQSQYWMENVRRVVPMEGFERVEAEWHAGIHGVKPPLFDLAGLSQVIDYDVQAYVRTLLKNYTTRGLHAHCCSTLRYLVEEKAAANATIRLLAKKKALDNSLLADPQVEDIVMNFRRIGNMPAAKGGWDAKEAAAIELRHRMNGYLAAAPLRTYVKRSTGETKEWHPKLFSLVPHARKAAKFITLDGRAIRQILRANGRAEALGSLPDNEHLYELLNFGHRFLRRMVDVQKLVEPKTIKTNGRQVCFPFLRGEGNLRPGKHPLPEDDEPTDDRTAFKRSIAGLFTLDSVTKANASSFTHVVAVDPGICSIATTDSGLMFTRADYYEGTRTSKRQLARRARAAGTRGAVDPDKERIRLEKKARKEANVALRKEQIAQKQREMQEHHMVVHDFEAFRRGLAVFLTHTEDLRMHYSRSDALSRRFRGYKRRCRATESMMNMLAPPSIAASTVVAFGAGYFGRRALPGDSVGPPVSKVLRRRLAGHCRVVLVDEYLTSQKCCTCGSQLYLHDRDVECFKCDTKMNRDINAAKNIGAIFRARAQGKPRPPALLRPE